jgi:hypothetical protein
MGFINLVEGAADAVAGANSAIVDISIESAAIESRRTFCRISRTFCCF